MIPTPAQILAARENALVPLIEVISEIITSEWDEEKDWIDISIDQIADELKNIGVDPEDNPYNMRYLNYDSGYRNEVRGYAPLNKKIMRFVVNAFRNKGWHVEYKVSAVYSGCRWNFVYDDEDGHGKSWGSIDYFLELVESDSGISDLWNYLTFSPRN